MKNAGNYFLAVLLLFLCGTFVSAQKVKSYPANADDIIAAVEMISKIDFSVEDAVKQFGEINETGEADEWAFELTPFTSEQERVESVTLYIYDEERRKLDGVSINYVEPISISFGKLRQKYGKPKPLPLPIVLCRSGNDCRPAFTGYQFTLKPAAASKNFGITISLVMEWSKTIPKHADKDFLKVKSIGVTRIHLD